MQRRSQRSSWRLGEFTRLAALGVEENREFLTVYEALIAQYQAPTTSESGGSGRSWQKAVAPAPVRSHEPYLGWRDYESRRCRGDFIKTLLVATGSKAVENAVKMAPAPPAGRTIACWRRHHGHAHGADSCKIRPGHRQMRAFIARASLPALLA